MYSVNLHLERERTRTGVLACSYKRLLKTTCQLLQDVPGVLVLKSLNLEHLDILSYKLSSPWRWVANNRSWLTYLEMKDTQELIYFYLQMSSLIQPQFKAELILERLVKTRVKTRISSHSLCCSCTWREKTVRILSGNHSWCNGYPLSAKDWTLLGACTNLWAWGRSQISTLVFFFPLLLEL